MCRDRSASVRARCASGPIGKARPNLGMRLQSLSVPSLLAPRAGPRDGGRPQSARISPDARPSCFLWQLRARMQKKDKVRCAKYVMNMEGVNFGECICGAARDAHEDAALDKERAKNDRRDSAEARTARTAPAGGGLLGSGCGSSGETAPNPHHSCRRGRTVGAQAGVRALKPSRLIGW